MTEISRAITIIDLILAPAHIIISRPNDTLGKLLIIVKYGSITLARNLFHHKILAIKIPIKVPSEKLISVSYVVIHICLNKLLLLYKLISELITLLGLENMNVFIISLSASICQVMINIKIMDTCTILINRFVVLIFFKYFICSLLCIFINIPPY